MMRIFQLLLIVSVSSFFLSCNQATRTDRSEPPTTADNSRNALDWAGTYRGITPCADCEGIETEIVLTYDETYVVKTKYLGKDDQFFVEEGRFRWNAQGSAIILDRDMQSGARQYLVGENRLFQLDMQGNRIRGPLADHYIIKKMPE